MHLGCSIGLAMGGRPVTECWMVLGGIPAERPRRGGRRLAGRLAFALGLPSGGQDMAMP